MSDSRVKVCGGHTRPVCHIAYSRVCDGSYWFVSSSHDSKPMLRNGETGDWVGTFSGHSGAVYGSCISHDSHKAVTVSGDYTAKIWNCLDGSCLNTWNHPHYVKSCDWMHGKVITGCFDKRVRLFDAVNYDTMPSEWQPHDTICKAVYFTENGHIVTSSEDVVALWDIRTDTLNPVKKHNIQCLNFVEHVREYSQYVVAAHKTGVSLIDLKNFEISQTFSSSDDVECACISPDGKNLAIGSGLLVKECSIDGELQRLHYGHHGPIFHVRYSPTGENFTSGAEDGMIRIWPALSCMPIEERKNE